MDDGQRDEATAEGAVVYVNGKPVEGLRGFRVLVDPDAEAKFTYAELKRAAKMLEANEVKP